MESMPAHLRLPDVPNFELRSSELVSFGRFDRFVKFDVRFFGGGELLS